MTIEVLDPQETLRVLRGRTGQNAILASLADALKPLVDTDGSVWATGLDESTLNMLRTKMSRLGMRLSARKVRRGDEVGHILLVRSAK